MKKFVAISLFLLFTQAVIAQASFGVKINGGVSRFSDNLFNPEFGTQKTYFMPSGQAGIFYNLPIRTHEVFSVELLFSQITGKQKDVDTMGTYNSNGTSTKLISSNTISRNISYLSLPIYYGIKVKKITCKVGLQVSVALTSSGKSVDINNYIASGYSISPGTTTYTLDAKRLYIKDAAFGETASIAYSFNPKFAIEANYYYELSNLYRKAKLNGSSNEVWKFQQMTLGLRYTFLISKKKEVAK